MSRTEQQRCDDAPESAASTEEASAWNTPEPAAVPNGTTGELPVAVRRVLATDQHLTQRRVSYGEAEEEKGAG